MGKSIKIRLPITVTLGKETYAPGQTITIDEKEGKELLERHGQYKGTVEAAPAGQAKTEPTGPYLKLSEKYVQGVNVKGVEYSMLRLISTAMDDGGLTVAAWNKLSMVDRDALINLVTEDIEKDASPAKITTT